MQMMRLQSRMPRLIIQSRHVRYIIDSGSYGVEKSACEMLFSYGFISSDVSSANALYLDLEIPEDDPLKRPKLVIARSAPGFRIHDSEGQISWNSDFVWLICINEEDGLRFGVQQTVDGDKELVAFWKGDEMTDASKLEVTLKQDCQWNLYLLRAVCIMQDRIRGQLNRLADSEELVQQRMSEPGYRSTFRTQPFNLSKRLRDLESKLLNGADSFFESEVGVHLFCLKCASMSCEYSAAQKSRDHWRGYCLFK